MFGTCSKHLKQVQDIDATCFLTCAYDVPQRWVVFAINKKTVCIESLNISGVKRLNINIHQNNHLGGGLEHVLISPRKMRKIPIFDSYFSDGLVQPPK